MSMELISKEEVKKLLNEGWYSGVYPSSAIMSLPTVKAIPLDRLEQIRAEIEDELNIYSNMSYRWHERVCGLRTAIEIIDKYREQEQETDIDELIGIIDKAIKEQNE